MRQWAAPLSIALSIQVVVSAADMAVPVLGPVVTAAAGVPAAHVGYYASAVAAGAVAFYLFGASITHRYGAVRTLQIGAVLAALSLLLVLTGAWVVILLAGLLIGIGFGANTPASAELLHRHVPPERLGLAFSVKQAGMPIGAILAGLSLPVLAQIWGWQAAILAASGLGLVAVLLVQPLRSRYDTRAPGEANAASGTWVDLRALADLSKRADIRRLMVYGALLAVVQGSVNAFLVTYLVTALGHSLVLAGSLYSLYQVIGIAGRIASGWLADRALGRLRMLAVIGTASGAAAILLSGLTAATPLSLIVLCVLFAGLVTGSWNGILLAEVTEAAPDGRVPEANNVTAIGVFAGFMLGPTLFGQAITMSDFETAFVLLAACAALSLLALRR